MLATEPLPSDVAERSPGWARVERAMRCELEIRKSEWLSAIAELEDPKDVAWRRKLPKLSVNALLSHTGCARSSFYENHRKLVEDIHKAKDHVDEALANRLKVQRSRQTKAGLTALLKNAEDNYKARLADRASTALAELIERLGPDIADRQALVNEVNHLKETVQELERRGRLKEAMIEQLMKQVNQWNEP